MENCKKQNHEVRVIKKGFTVWTRCESCDRHS